MPELPEVETVCQGLMPFMLGFTFEKVILNRPNLRFPFADEFIFRLVGARVEHLSRRAKFIYIQLSTNEQLLMHLGMSGRFTVSTPDSQQASGPSHARHDHVIFIMSSGAKIIYNDPRRFGFMELFGSGETSRLDALGPEPLSNHFNGTILHTALAARKTAIKSALLNQHIVAGLGNIYVCEALFRAGISPLRRSNRLSQDETQLLCSHIKDVLGDAIAAGGSSLKDFAATDGELGYFQHSFDVYGRADAACKSCAAPIKRINQSGRSSFFCPVCQV